MQQLRFLVKGRVQGVGFRYFACTTAESIGIRGYAKNLVDGSVEVVAEGNEGQLAMMEQALREGPSFGRVDEVLKSVSEVSADRFTGFTIR